MPDFKWAVFKIYVPFEYENEKKYNALEERLSAVQAASVAHRHDSRPHLSRTKSIHKHNVPSSYAKHRLKQSLDHARISKRASVSPAGTYVHVLMI